MTTELVTNEDLFYSYPSIENSYREEFINKIYAHGYGDERYYVTEKIHGSNTQLSYDGNEFKYGTRSHYLVENEKCYNVQPLLDKIKSVLEAEYKRLKEDVPTLRNVIIYGEVYGGCYPHPDVKVNNHASKVQKGVYYSPNNEWSAFDFCYVDDNGKHFYPGSQFINLCQTNNIRYVPVLAIVDTLKEALEFNNAGESTVGPLLGYPELENNTMEGVVIKPLDKDLWMGQTRVVIKNKNDKFKEKSHEKKVNIQIELPECVTKALEASVPYINENRVNNVISHLGEVTYKDTGRIIGETNKDVLAVIQDEVPEYNLMEKQERKQFTKLLNNEVAKVVRKVMQVR